MVVESIANIILSVSFISSFIGAFFFTYGHVVEEHIITTQSKFVASELSRDMNLLPDPVIQKIKDTLVIPDLSEEDTKAEEYNSLLKSEAIVVLSIVLITGILVSWALCLWKKISFFDTVKQNLIILVFVGITEFIFLTFFAQSVIIADPRFVRVEALKTIANEFPSDTLVTIPKTLPPNILPNLLT